MAWYSTDWNRAQWYGPEWHDSAASLGGAPWFPEGWDEADWYASNWHTANADPELVNDWYGVGWSGIDWYAPQWFESTSTGSQFGFVQSGIAGEFSVDGFAGVYRTSFIRQGISPSIGAEGRYAGFLPDTGGILDNDSDPDGDPLSYEIVTLPSAGTLTAYAGGAFTWEPGDAPPGRYNFTYRLWAGGEQAATLGIVTIEYGNLFGEVSLAGYAGQLSGFIAQGTRATLSVTGFAGILQYDWNGQGTAGAANVVGFGGIGIHGQTIRGTFGLLTPIGFGGLLSDQFIGRGSSGTLDITGFAGEIDLVDFLNAAGTAGTLTVIGYAAGFSGFVERGTRATVTADGLAGLLQIGLDGIPGTAGQLQVTGFGQPPDQVGKVVDFSVSANYADFVIKPASFDWRVE